MDLQASIQLVSDYRPGDDPAASLLPALRELTAAMTDTPKLGDGIRPVVRALVAAAAHLPAEWSGTLALLRRVLADPTVPWLHRAFVLKALPGMITDTPAELRKQHGDEFCEVLVLSALPRASAEGAAEESEQQTNNPQERRVALAALLSLPRDFAAAIAEKLTAQLPLSLSTCIAVVSSPSTHEEIKEAFEEWICSPSAAEHESCVMDIEKTLKEHFRGYGGLRCERLCGALISREPLKKLSELESLKRDLSLLEKFDVSHRRIISNRISLAFLLAKTTEVLDLAYPAAEQDCLEKNVEDLTLSLSVIQLLVQLSYSASVMPDSLRSEEVQNISTLLFSIDSADAVLDAPLPLIECILHLVLRALPCLSTRDAGLQQLLSEVIRVTATILPVVEDAVLKIHAAIFLISNSNNSNNHEQQRQQQPAKENAKTVVNEEEVVEEKEKNEKEGSTTTGIHNNTVVALHVAQTVAQLCRICMEKLHNSRMNRQQQHQHEGKEDEEKCIHKVLEEVSALVHSVTPSWRGKRERERRAHASSWGPANQQPQRESGNFTGKKREAQHAYRQLRNGDRGAVDNNNNNNNTLFKRRRHDPPL